LEDAVMPISYREAGGIALASANAVWGYPTEDDELVLLEQHCRERESGWFFVYNTRSFATTGNRDHSLLGNGVMFVSRADGAVVRYPSSYSMERAILEHERGG
jgi:hypothetical protein